MCKLEDIIDKRLEESKLLPLLSLRRLRLYVELKRTSKCVVGEAYGFSSSYAYNCKGCSKISWKFMFYFMICSYSKLEETKREFVNIGAKSIIILIEKKTLIDSD